MNKNQKKLRAMIITALFAAIIGILAQITIPLPLVPITGQTLAVGLSATILGARYGTYSVILYIIIGAAGVPVYSEFSAGISRLVGPTGGYLIGFIPAAFIMGRYLERLGFTIRHAFIANLIGMILTLIIGTLWISVAADLSLKAAIVSGFTPFIVVGIIKAFLAAWLGIIIRNRLASAKLLASVEPYVNRSI